MPVSKKPKKSLRRIRPTEGPSPDPVLESMYRKLKQYRDAGLDNRARFLKLELDILEYCKSKGVRSYDHNGVKFAAVRPIGEEVDWDGIRDALGPARWAQILGDPQPVKAKLEALVELDKTGELAKLIDPFITDKEIKSHVRFNS